MKPIDFILCALNSRPAPFPTSSVDDYAGIVLCVARFHGVAPLLYYTALAHHTARGWPDGFLADLRALSTQHAIRELFLQRELSSLLGRLHSDQVEALLLKGTPLAYTAYPAPYLRTRSDTDVLIRPEHRRSAHETLRAAGYTAHTPWARELGSYQQVYSRVLTPGVTHVVDLHWRVNDRQIFARAFSFDELWQRAQPVELLSPYAWAPGPADQLLIAALHRAHHMSTPYFADGVPQYEGNRLLWIYDMHLLSESFSVQHWSRLVTAATDKGLCSVCLDALIATRERFATKIPARVLSELESSPSAEPSSKYLQRGEWKVRLTVDLPAIDSWWGRAKLLTEWLFPPARYMLQKYNTQQTAFLPLLYLRRALGRVFKRGNPRGKAKDLLDGA